MDTIGAQFGLTTHNKCSPETLLQKAHLSRGLRQTRTAVAGAGVMGKQVQVAILVVPFVCLCAIIMSHTLLPCNFIFDLMAALSTSLATTSSLAR